jgi:DNA-binding beta-propeller fold protein YncE
MTTSGHQVYKVGASPGQIVYDPANGLLYVANTCCSSKFLSVINPKTGLVTKITTADFKYGEMSLVYDPQYKEVYVGGVSSLSGLYGLVIIKGTNVVQAGIDKYCPASAMAIDTKNGRIYVVCPDTDNGAYLDVIQPTSPNTAKLVATLDPFGGEEDCLGGGIIYNPSNNLVYTTDGCGAIVTIDPKTNAVSYVPNTSIPPLAPVLLCNNEDFSYGCTIKYDPANNIVYVYDAYQTTPDGYAGAIGCINAKFILALCLAPRPGFNSSSITNVYGDFGMAYNPTNKALYVANFYEGMVSKVNDQNKIVANYSVPLSLGTPNYVAYDSANGHIYATTSNGYVYEVV